MPPGRVMSFTSSYWSEKWGHPLKSFLAVTKPKSYVSNCIHSAQKLDPRLSSWCWCWAGCLQQRIRAEKEYFDRFSIFNPKFQQFQNVQDTSILQGAFKTSFVSPFKINYVLVPLIGKMFEQKTRSRYVNINSKLSKNKRRTNSVESRNSFQQSPEREIELCIKLIAI